MEFNGKTKQSRRDNFVGGDDKVELNFMKGMEREGEGELIMNIEGSQFNEL
jgi:hypothetical protein